jgi:hypothetical protein
MTGKKLIIIREENSYPFHEHALLHDAQVEARRLATEVGGTFIIYAPVQIIKRPLPHLTEETVMPFSMMQGFRSPPPFADDEESLPF